MKKIVYFVVVAFAVLFVACNKVNTESPEGKVIVNISVANIETSTKAVKTAWNDGDKINIWFDGAYWNELPHLILTYNSGTSSWDASSVDESKLSSSGSFIYVYEASNTLFSSAINNTYAYSKEGDAETILGTYRGTIYSEHITIYGNNIAYTYNSSTKTLTSTISTFCYKNPVQIVIKGLDPSNASNYCLTVRGTNKFTTCDALFYYNGGISESSTQSGGFTRGTYNTDGVAFLFYRTAGDSELDYTFYLYDKVNNKVTSRTVHKSIPYSTDRCRSYTLSSTTDWTEYTGSL